MKRFFSKIICLCFFITVSLLLNSCSQGNDNNTEIKIEAPYVLMVSFDGFRSDYVEKWHLPNFQKLINQGSAVEGLIPSYPSKTFPNHYTLVTGLYPGNHGLVDNTFFNKQKSAVYSMGKREAVEDPDFYGGLPLWQYAQQNGLKSASFFWVGSEAPIAGSYPTYYKIYDNDVKNSARIEQVFQWLQLPAETRPNFITLYFSFVDSISHKHGPLSFETEKAAREADKLVGKIIQEIEESHLPVNLIITSDHGMYPVKNELESIVNLSELSIDEEKLLLINGQTQAHLYVHKTEEIEEIYLSLKAQEENFQVLLKEDTPAHWHYSDNENIGDILIVAEPGTVLMQTAEPLKDESRVIGVHGYDPRGITDLYGIFYASGPNIKVGEELPAIENIHVFPFITELLQLPPLTTIDGTIDVLQPFLQFE